MKENLKVKFHQSLYMIFTLTRTSQKLGEPIADIVRLEVQVQNLS